MTKVRKRKQRNFEELLHSPSADSLKAKVPIPMFVTLRQLARQISGYRSARGVFLQLTGDGRAKKERTHCTVGKLKAALEERSEFPADTSCVYLVTKADRLGLNAWPIIWAGDHKGQFILLGYLDPIRFGFKSQSTDSITVGPDAPLPVEKRQFGLDIDYGTPSGRIRKRLRFEPMGERLTARQLTSRYGREWRDVIGDIVAPLPREKGEQPLWEAKQPLPSKDEFDRLAEAKFTKTVQQMIDDAYETISNLGSELREAFERTPESLQETDVAIAREEAATVCEDIAGDKPDAPKKVSKLTILRRPVSRGKSRRDEAGEAAATLEAVAAEVEKNFDIKRDSKLTQFVEHILQHAGEIEDIEFPGMFG